MKKIALIAGGITLIALAACKKEEQVTVEPGMASVKMNIVVNTDETNDTIYDGSYEVQYELLPNATPVAVEYDSRDVQLNPKPGYTYANVTETATIGTDGMLNVTVPATTDAHNITLKFQDLELTRTFNGVSGLTGDDTVFVETRIYERTDVVVSVYDGASVLMEDIEYTIK